MTPCREWRGPKNADGYGVKWCYETKKRYLTHRWVMAQIVGDDAIRGRHVMHLCHNRACFRFDHLEIGTHAENNRAMWERGAGVSNWKPKPGESNPAAKFSDELVEQIRARSQAGESQASIVRSTGVGRSQVSRIVNGKTRVS